MSEDDKTKFLKCFEQLKEELVRDEIEDNQVQIAVDWIREMISYNVPHGSALDGDVEGGVGPRSVTLHLLDILHARVPLGEVG